MILVLDNNIFFSLMNPDSTNAYLFSILNVKFIAPEFIKEELEEHKSECLAKSKLSEQEFTIRKNEIEESIEFIDILDYKIFLKKALSSLSDPDDSPYLALALSKNCAIWSNDSHIKKQELAEVFTTEELIIKNFQM